MVPSILESKELSPQNEFARPVTADTPNLDPEPIPQPHGHSTGFSYAGGKPLSLQLIGGFIKAEQEKMELLKLAGVSSGAQFQLSMESFSAAMKAVGLDGFMGPFMSIFKALGLAGDEGLADKMKTFGQIINDIDKGNKKDFMTELHKKVDSGELVINGSTEKFFKDVEKLADKIYEDGQMGVNERKALETKLADSTQYDEKRATHYAVQAQNGGAPLMAKHFDAASFNPYEKQYTTPDPMVSELRNEGMRLGRP